MFLTHFILNFHQKANFSFRICPRPYLFFTFTAGTQTPHTQTCRQNILNTARSHRHLTLTNPFFLNPNSLLIFGKQFILTCVLCYRLLPAVCGSVCKFGGLLQQLVLLLQHSQIAWGTPCNDNTVCTFLKYATECQLQESMN